MLLFKGEEVGEAEFESIGEKCRTIAAASPAGFLLAWRITDTPSAASRASASWPSESYCFRPAELDSKARLDLLFLLLSLSPPFPFPKASAASASARSASGVRSRE